ncbi:MAG: hypothetical protein WAM82_24490 [Thermoanaerobaculia bacterium]
MRSTLPRPLALVLGLALLGVACTQTPPPVPPAAQAPPAKTAVIHSAKTGRTYTAVQLAEPEAAREPIAAVSALGAPSSDNFRGTDRAGAKTSIVDGDPQTFDDVSALASSGLLVDDDQMLHHDPAITRDSDARFDEEGHNVVVTAFLYASKKEGDNDFHCIIGAAPDQTPVFFNVEVSGLPQGQFRQQLQDVRDAFKTFFAGQLPGTGYSKFDPPIPVRITGSLFYDIDHKPGEVGPAAFKPTTAWEIHPVSAIEFEPQ